MAVRRKLNIIWDGIVRCNDCLLFTKLTFINIVGGMIRCHEMDEILPEAIATATEYEQKFHFHKVDFPHLRKYNFTFIC